MRRPLINTSVAPASNPRSETEAICAPSMLKADVPEMGAPLAFAIGRSRSNCSEVRPADCSMVLRSSISTGFGPTSAAVAVVGIFEPVTMTRSVCAAFSTASCAKSSPIASKGKPHTSKRRGKIDYLSHRTKGSVEG